MTMEAEILDFDEVLKILANPARRKILAQLREPEQNFPGQVHSYDIGVCASRIEAAANLSQSTISAHLALLVQARLLTARRVGQWVFYRRNEPAIAAFLARMEQSL